MKERIDGPGRRQTVIVAGSQPSAGALARQFESKGWTAVVVSSCAELAAALDSSRVALVCCSPTMPDGNWRDALGAVRIVSRDVVVVVFAICCTPGLYLDFLSCGVADLLPDPCPDATLSDLLARIAGRRAGSMTAEHAPRD